MSANLSRVLNAAWLPETGRGGGLGTEPALGLRSPGTHLRRWPVGLRPRAWRWCPLRKREGGRSGSSAALPRQPARVTGLLPGVRSSGVRPVFLLHPHRKRKGFETRGVIYKMGEKSVVAQWPRASTGGGFSEYKSRKFCYLLRPHQKIHSVYGYTFSCRVSYQTQNNSSSV